MLAALPKPSQHLKMEGGGPPLTPWREGTQYPWHHYSGMGYHTHVELKLRLSADPMTPTERSQRMSLVKSKQTQPEILVRKIIRRLGYNYRSHLKALPGTPDFVFPDLKKVIFVHGCFWHQHGVCRKDGKPRMPKSRLDYWQLKLVKNRARDLHSQKKLNKLGWRYLVTWECQLKNRGKLAQLLGRIKAFLNSTD
jgi:DNA mismatch endonuclease (patch repair protein)